MSGLLDLLQKAPVERCMILNHEPTGLRAFLVLDDLTLGPAAGGVRTRSYPSPEAALEDAIRLAKAMTIKCALAGLDAGGGKAVVMEQYLKDRPAAFARLGQYVEELRGAFRTAGDLGTTSADLAAMAATTQYVHTDESHLTAAVARGLVRTLEACTEIKGRRGIANLRVAVQGCGNIGAAVARRLVTDGVHVIVADVDASRAETLAQEIGADVCSPLAVLLLDVDVVSPCAVGGVITPEMAGEIRAWAVCGAANNILHGPDAGRVLMERGILFVPDVISSAGAVIDGIGASVMKLDDRTELIDRLRGTARDVLNTALHERRLPTEVAEDLARHRIRFAQPD